MEGQSTFKSTESHQHPTHTEEHETAQSSGLTSNLLKSRSGEMQLGSPENILVLQRTIGNKAVQRMIAKRTERLNSISQRNSSIQRALTPGLMAKEPTYNDGLTLSVIESTAVDKEVMPDARRDKKKWMRQNGKDTGLSTSATPTAKEIAADDVLINKAISEADTAHVFLQTGDVHGNQVYQNKSGDLDFAGAAYLEYDVSKYTRGTNRGGLRVVTGNDGKNKKYYYTSDHYKNFQEFTPASAVVAPTPPVVATPPVVSSGTPVTSNP